MIARLTISERYHSVSIGKDTLRLLDNPDSVLLLVNPEEGTLAVRKNDHEDPRGHKVKTDGKGMFRLYSKSLCTAMAPYLKEPEGERKAVTLHGTLKEDAVLFFLNGEEPSEYTGRIPS